MVPVLAVTFDSCVVISLGHVVAVAPIAWAGFTASLSLLASRGFSAVFTVRLTVIKQSWLKNVACGEKLCCRFCLFKIRTASRSLPWGRWPSSGCLPTAILLPRVRPQAVQSGTLTAVGRQDSSVHCCGWATNVCAYAATETIFILSFCPAVVLFGSWNSPPASLHVLRGLGWSCAPWCLAAAQRFVLFLSLGAQQHLLVNWGHCTLKDTFLAFSENVLMFQPCLALVILCQNFTFARALMSFPL